MTTMNKELDIKELIVLKKQFNDTDFHRVYKILNKIDDLIDVEIIIEKPNNGKKEGLGIGKIFKNVPMNNFEPYY